MRSHRNLLHAVGVAFLISLATLASSAAPPPPGPVASVGLYYTFTSDPTTGVGYAAPLWQLGIRTDVASVYYKSGISNTAWTRIGAGAGGGGGSGTVTSVGCGSGVVCTPTNPSTTTVTITANLSGATCGAGSAVTGFNAFGSGTCGAFSPPVTGTAPITCTGGVCSLNLCTNGSLYLEASGSWACTTVSGALDTITATQGALMFRGASLWSQWSDVSVPLSGDLTLAQSAFPTQPAAGSGQTISSTTIAGRPFLTTTTALATGVAGQMQDLIGRRSVQMLIPNAGANSLTALGTVATATGTPTARNPASTSFATSLKRIGYVSTAVIDSLAGVRYASAGFAWRGNAAGLGGFFAVFRFLVSDAVIVSVGRTFVGLESSVAAPSDVEPSTLTNVFGVCAGSADTQLKMCMSGGSAQAPVTINGGSGFPINTTTNTDVYELVISAKPDDTSVSWAVTDLTTGIGSSGTQSGSASLFSSTTFMTYQYWRSNSGSSSAVGLDVVDYYEQQDN